MDAVCWEAWYTLIEDSGVVAWGDRLASRMTE